MIGKRSLPVVLVALATVATGAFAVFIAFDTVRTVARSFSPLPWFDAWATFKLLKMWTDAAASPAAILFAQHNEHRILVPRLVFFADVLWFHGQGQIEVVAIFVVQALHAALFLRVLDKACPAAMGRWAIGGCVVALMFSLAQSENFGSGFQLTFVGVFTAATASFLLFARAASVRSRGAGALVCSLAAALVSAMTMANGILASFVLVALALLARQGWRVVIACTAWAVAIGILYLHGYEPVAQNARPLDVLTEPVAFTSYVAVYLGSVLGPTRAGAGALGLIGILATVAATFRVATARPLRPTSLMLVGVMLFVGASAALTASGRITFSLQQALSSRYATASVTFWCAQLCFWWTDPPRPPAGRPMAWQAQRAAAAVLGILLLIAVGRAQSAAKPDLWTQYFKLNDASNLLLLGLDDPTVIGRTAWDDGDVRNLMPMLRERRLSIFGGPDGGLYGAPLDRQGLVVQPDVCTGSITTAVADLEIGTDGARIAGLAWDRDERRQIRRVLLADERGTIVGLASSGVPGQDPSTWRGYAVAAAGETLRAYGVLDRQRLCALGSPRSVAAPGSGKVGDPS